MFNIKWKYSLFCCNLKRPDEDGVPPHFSLHFWENSSNLSTPNATRVHSPNTDLTQSTYDHLLSPPISQSFLHPHSDKGIGKGGKSLPPLHYASVSAFQVLSCLRVETMGIWDTILHYAIFKEILHNSSFFFLSFWRAILKVSLADPFNLTSLWSWSAKSWRLGCVTSRGMGWYWDDNEACFSKEWMN